MFRQGQCLLPDRRHRVRVDLVAKRLDIGADLGITLLQGQATPGAIRQVDALHRQDEGGDLPSQPVWIGDVPDGRTRAVEPAVDRPPIGITFARLSHAQGLRDLDGKVRRELGKPPLLPLDHALHAGASWHADHHVLTEPVERVVGPGRRNRPDRQVRPLRELVFQQAMNL